MNFLLRLLQLLFSKHKCLVYTASGYEGYFKIVNRLESHGIIFRTVTRYNLSSSAGRWSPRKHQNVPYNIYVRKEDEYKTLQAIHDKPMYSDSLFV